MLGFQNKVALGENKSCWKTFHIWVLDQEHSFAESNPWFEQI